MAACGCNSGFLLSSPYLRWRTLSGSKGVKNASVSLFSTQALPLSASESAGGNGERRISEQSSWESKDSEGNDYLFRLGQEADNVNITVGARAGVIDDLFTGGFLGKDADIVFDYRQKVTRSFEYLHGDYYIAPLFLVPADVKAKADSALNSNLQSSKGPMDQFVHSAAESTKGKDSQQSTIETIHLVKNYIAHSINFKVPLILGIWGGKGQGKTFQTELIFRAMGIEPVIMSAGELESEKAGEPGKLIRERYRTASQVVQNQGKMSCLMINDIDAGLGRFGNTQRTVNNQIVGGTLMYLSDNPTRVSTGQKWRESDVTHRVPIIVTGNDFSTLYAPLVRDGRMEKFYLQPDHLDVINIVHRMYAKDGISKSEVQCTVDAFPNQALDFYGALRSSTYDEAISKVMGSTHPTRSDSSWSVSTGIERCGHKCVACKKGEKLPVFTPPKMILEKLVIRDHSLKKSQNKGNNTWHSNELFRNVDELMLHEVF
ncbi:hypothetical protein KSP40_PGU005647 [Platanthera guangdongensis]|uniref:Ribulose bisphosphate carboxylase/oxygenase activase, chloroplastic n=1 Tax=Platanthera guangdongensis TaxID=2320717 RepID=A0ABR2MYD4_9ASPA